MQRPGDDVPVEGDLTQAHEEVPELLPAAISRAWGLQAAPARGPRPALSAERIVESAVVLADTEGLAAVSMSRVATQLGASTMALYRHVAAKEELLLLMVDAAYGDPPPRDGAADGTGGGTDGGDWRAGMSHWAHSIRAVLHRHPWILGVPISGPPALPHEVAWMEQGLAAMRDTGLAEAEKLSVILLVSGFVRNEATLMAGLVAAQQTGSATLEVMANYGRILSRVLDPDRHPAISAALAAGVFDGDDPPDTEFTFGLERLLDGIEVLVRRRDEAPSR